MIAGPPGAFKSTLALNLLVRWAQQGVYGLYFSADADEFTTAKRAAAILTQRPVETVETGLRSASGAHYQRALMAMDHTRWVYTAADIDEIDRHMRGFEAVYGSFPHVVFIDNLLNMSGGASEDWTAAREMIRELDILARSAECHVAVLHHTSETGYSPGIPPARKEILGKLSQFPRLILTLGSFGSTMNVAVVKNSNGPDDPTGKTFFPMILDAERCSVADSGFYQQGSFAVG
jgi:hypothetical protein